MLSCGISWGSHQTLWRPPLPNVLNVHCSALLLVPQWQCISSFVFDMTFWDMVIYSDTLNWSNITPIFEPITELDPITNFDIITIFQEVSIEHCWSGPIWDLLSWTCHVYGPFEFRTSLGTSILRLCFYCDCPHLGSWLNANLNGQSVIAIWRIGWLFSLGRPVIVVKSNISYCLMVLRMICLGKVGANKTRLTIPVGWL